MEADPSELQGSFAVPGLCAACRCSSSVLTTVCIEVHISVGISWMNGSLNVYFNSCFLLARGHSPSTGTRNICEEKICRQ